MTKNIVVILFIALLLSFSVTVDAKLDVFFPADFVPLEHYAKNIEPIVEHDRLQVLSNEYVLQDGDVDYLIITDSSFWNVFNDNFKEWRISTSDTIHSLEIVNTSVIYTDKDTWVYGRYGDANNDNPWITNISENISLFNDSQCKIRNFIRKYVSEKNTSYVLLAGNRDFIPVRMATTYGHSGPTGKWYNQTHAVDMYYSNLHCSMNNNSNSKWMENKFGDGVDWITVPEWDEIDWEYDVLVGRALINSVENCFLWINKTKNYVNSIDTDYLMNGIVATKDVDNNIDDYVWTRIGDEFSEDFSFVNGQNISQAQWNIADDYCNGVVEGWGGIALIYHSGHGGTFWTPYQPSNTNNSLIPNFMYTEGCHSANFGSQINSRMEQWMRDDGGVFAGVANSAYGWFIASSWYGEEMMGLMFNDTYGVLENNFCKAHFDARENVGWQLHSVAPMIFKSTNFFGCPAVTFNTYDEYANQHPVFNDSYPVNNSADYDLFLTWNITITDPEGDLFNWSIECSNGQSNTGDNDVNGTKSLDLTILEYNISYIVWVNATDEHGASHNEWFMFSTKELFQTENYVSVYNKILSVFISMPDAEYLDVYFYWGNDTLIHVVENVENETIVNISLADYCTLPWLQHDTTYIWYVIIDNNGSLNESEIWSFYTSKAWDLNEDGVVNYLDLSILVSEYGLTCLYGELRSDINEDGIINYLDISILVSHYRKMYT